MPRKRCWAAVTVLLSACSCAYGSPLSLRLDRSLSPVPQGRVDARTEMLVRFGVGELRHRVGRLHDRAEAVREDNRVLSQRVVEHDALLTRLRDLSVSQGRVLDDLRAVLDTRSDARAQPSPPVPSVPAPVQVQAPAPAAVPAPERRLAPASAVVVTGMPEWMAPAGLGGAALALLAWVALLLRRRRMSAVSADQGAADDEVTDWVEQAAAMSAMSAASGEAAPHDAGARAQTSKPVTAVPIAGARSDTVDLHVVAAGAPRSTPEVALPTNTGSGSGAADHKEQRSPKIVDGEEADSYALKEVDTLIAFEQYEAAKAALEEMLVADPDNPELLLRHYHVRTGGGADAATDDAELLHAMMDGPLSDTMTRVRDIGHGLMPGDALVQGQGQRDAVVKVLGAGKGGKASAPRNDAAHGEAVQDGEAVESTPKGAASALRIVDLDEPET